MPTRRERLLDSQQQRTESGEARAARQIAAAYERARRELIATLIEGWPTTGALTPVEAADQLRRLTLLNQVDARLRQLETESGTILRSQLLDATQLGIDGVSSQLALLPPSLRPDDLLIFATINERMIERFLPTALDGLRVSTNDIGLTLRRELQAGVIQGEAFPTLVRRLLRSVPEGEGPAVFPRAKTSAQLATRRAVITAENATKVEAIGVVAEQVPEVGKQAIAAIGKNTTDCCLRVHGQIKRVSEPFELTGEPRFADRMMAPSFHWNCRTAVAMHHPFFEESMPTAKLKEDAKAELAKRETEVAKRREESAAGRRTRREREATDAERQEETERRQAAELERQRQAAREEVADLSEEEENTAADALAQLREQAERAPMDELRSTVSDLNLRIRAAEEAGNEALEDELRAQLSVVVDVGLKRQEAEREQRRQEAERRKAEPAKRNIDNLTIEQFAALVDQAAAGTTAGRFNEEKVFIASVWEKLRSDGIDISLDEFKRRLVEASQQSLITLSRADFQGDAPRALVEASEINRFGATQHYIRHSPTPAESALPAGGALPLDQLEDQLDTVLRQFRAARTAGQDAEVERLRTEAARLRQQIEDAQTRQADREAEERRLRSLRFEPGTAEAARQRLLEMDAQLAPHRAEIAQAQAEYDNITLRLQDATDRLDFDALSRLARERVPALRRLEALRASQPVNPLEAVYVNTPTNIRLTTDGMQPNWRTGVEEFNRLVSRQVWADAEIRVDVLPDGARAHHTRGAIHVSRNETIATVIHELAHELEQSSGAQARIREFFERRTQGDEWESLRTLTGKAYRQDEVTKRDRWLHPYMGKYYPTEGITELISMGVEYLYRDPIGFSRDDPEMFDFIYDLVRGR